MTGEDRIQQAIVKFLRLAYPRFVTFAIPNGGGRSKAQGGILKATGVLAGIPDLCVLMPDAKALFIEVKTPKTLTTKKRYLSPDQRGIKSRLELLGFPVHVCRSVDDVAEVMRSL